MSPDSTCNYKKQINIIWRICFTIFYLPGLCGCLAESTSQTAVPSITPANPTLTPTNTPIWFPPTPTSTPYPTATQGATPTPLSAPEHGAVIFTDDFSDANLWELNRTSQSSAAINNHELTLATSKPKNYLYSIRKDPALRDYYIEINASPSICQGGDEYGLLLRYSDSGNFFRFALTCDGRVRVDRLLNNQPSSPQPRIFNGAVPPGAPSISRLAVQLLGRHLHFYVNGEYLFSINDPNMPEGKIGVFIRPEGDGAMTVNFSDLQVYRPLP